MQSIRDAYPTGEGRTIWLARRTLITGLAAFAASPVLAAPASPWLDYERRLQTRADDAAGGRFDGGFEADLLSLTNGFRADQGLTPLADDAELNRAARAHAADMAARKFFGHDTEEGFSPIDRAGLLVRRMLGRFGENLAYQSGVSRATPGMAMEGWKKSPGHRANLLGSDYTHVGHGVVRIGTSWNMAAVFGSRVSALRDSLPLRSDGALINAELRDAQMAAYFVSDPHAEPTGDPYPTPGLGPRLSAGAWRLRPLKLRAGRAFSVLWGPIIVV